MSLLHPPCDVKTEYDILKPLMICSKIVFHLFVISDMSCLQLEEAYTVHHCEAYIST